MGRPDLTEVRTAEILDAFERCVGRFGLEGSSLERVAEEAGMKRSILRHYVGNRDDLIHALAKRVVAKYREHLQAFVDSTTDDGRVDEILSYLLPDQPIETGESLLVVESLIAAGASYPDIRQLMFDYIDDLVNTITQQLRLAYPQATRKESWEVAYGVTSICFNQESLTPLQLPPRYLRAARNTALRLIETLDQATRS